MYIVHCISVRMMPNHLRILHFKIVDYGRGFKLQFKKLKNTYFGDNGGCMPNQGRCGGCLNWKGGIGATSLIPMLI